MHRRFQILPCPTIKSSRINGFALLIVLWTLGLMALLVGHLTGAGRAEAQLAGNLRRGAMIEAAADGAVAEAIFHALDSSDQHWAANGTVHRVRIGDALVDIRLDNEASKINPNIAAPALLAGLLGVVGLEPRAAQDLGTAIAEWRIPENQMQVSSRGARTGAYRSAGREYGPAGEPFQSLDELGLVLGMTPSILARIAPHLTIYADNAPDPAVADPVVKEAMRAAGGNGPVLPINPLGQLRRGPLGSRVGTGLNPESVVSVTVVAMGADRSRFVRHAIVRLADGSNGELFRILSWDTGAGA